MSHKTNLLFKFNHFLHIILNHLRVLCSVVEDDVRGLMQTYTIYHLNIIVLKNQSINK